MPRRVMFLQEPDGKTLSPNSCVPVLRRKGRIASQSANIRQMLLKFIFGPAFHLRLRRNNCVTLELRLRFEIWNSTKVLKDVRYGILGLILAFEASATLLLYRRSGFTIVAGIINRGHYQSPSRMYGLVQRVT